MRSILFILMVIFSHYTQAKEHIFTSYGKSLVRCSIFIEKGDGITDRYEKTLWLAGVATTINYFEKSGDFAKEASLGTIHDYVNLFCEKNPDLLVYDALFDMKKKLSRN
ncbi:hypothetical protein GKR48_14275 [Providencia sp. wls1943]|uniref:hypothetical protein n=1 Tax=Providencia sp. wls1943 TaxID=2675150 RepID=UPI0012B60FC7|nr:hypothetical protein [Providencia sp. wls1943]MTB67971.1 hypothetical protein [Providencia sp. wls1943]